MTKQIRRNLDTLASWQGWICRTSVSDPDFCELTALISRLAPPPLPARCNALPCAESSFDCQDRSRQAGNTPQSARVKLRRTTVLSGAPLSLETKINSVSLSNDRRHEMDEARVARIVGISAGTLWP
jgi:hypothetical protein